MSDRIPTLCCLEASDSLASQLFIRSLQLKHGAINKKAIEKAKREAELDKGGHSMADLDDVVDDAAELEESEEESECCRECKMLRNA